MTWLFLQNNKGIFFSLLRDITSVAYWRLKAILENMFFYFCVWFEYCEPQNNPHKNRQDVTLSYYSECDNVADGGQISRRVMWSYLVAVGAASTAAGPQLVSVLLVRPDPAHIGERELVAAVALLSVTQHHIVADVTLPKTRAGCCYLDSPDLQVRRGNTQQTPCTPLGLAGACQCSWMMSSLSLNLRQRGGATPHGLSSLVVTAATSLRPRPKLFQPRTRYW